MNSYEIMTELTDCIFETIEDIKLFELRAAEEPEKAGIYFDRKAASKYALVQIRKVRRAFGSDYWRTGTICLKMHLLRRAIDNILYESIAGLQEYGIAYSNTLDQYRSFLNFLNEEYEPEVEY